MAARQSAFEHLGSSRTMGNKLIRRGVNELAVCERMISMLLNTVMSSRQQLSISVQSFAAFSRRDELFHPTFWLSSIISLRCS
jgi:hypothetical protein